MSAVKVNRYLVVNIGCIECGVSSAIVGSYGTRKKAQAIADACEQSLSWRQSGQNAFEVFDLSAPQADEYTNAIERATGVRP